MGDILAGQNVNLILLAGITILLGVLLNFIFKIYFGSKNKEPNHEAKCDSDALTEQVTSEYTSTESRSTAKSKKRVPWKGKTEFSHPWLLKNLKGHPGTVLHADISANGKFLAVTCDDMVPTPVEASPPVMVIDNAATPRRRKSRDRRRCSNTTTSTSAPPPPKIFLNGLIEALRPHLLTQERMWALGFPVELEPNTCKAVLYVNPPPRPKHFTAWDVNAPEFVPSGSQGDSGRGSLGSTPRSESDEESDTVEHVCVRCDKSFRMSREGEYLTKEPCVHHYGRVSYGYHDCCKTPLGTKGCRTIRYHVWNGTHPGMNGPLDGYVRARLPRGGVYALDTEMCYTTVGLELASVAFVGPDGRKVYKELVTPSAPVLDYNTRYSGITKNDLKNATKSLRDVQNDILGFIGSDTVLIGHSLNNDLRALKLLHNVVIDTCALYPHERGLPFRRSLKDLCLDFLGRAVQQKSNGHSPLEDARAAMDLVLLKIQEESENRVRFAKQLHSLQPYDPLISAA